MKTTRQILPLLLLPLLLSCTLACSSHTVKYYVKKADKLVAKQDTRQAILVYQRAIKEFPAEPVLYINQAALLREEQQYTHAIRDYTIAINLNDQSLWPYIGLARVYLKQKQYKHAKEILQMGQEQLPLNGALDFYLGHVANATKQPELAVQHYTDAQEHAYPRADKIHYYRGLVYQNQLKDHAQAKQDFESFLKSNTTDTAQIAEVKQHLQSL